MHRIRPWLLALLLAGCASTPVIVLGPNAPTDLLAQQLALDTALYKGEARPGNAVALLRDGRQTFPAMFAAMAQARDSIDLEYYIFQDIHTAGDSLGDMLTRKLAQGVAVNIVMDGYGSRNTDPQFIARLQQAGAKVLVYHPLTPDAMLHLENPNDRDHRKIMVVDGKVAFVGGINLDRVYENHADPQAAVDGDAKHAFWTDTDARIEGPAVADLQHAFFDTWQRQGGPAVEKRSYYPPLAEAGQESVRIIASAPHQDRPLYYATFLMALHAAKRSVDLGTGFFVPTHQEREQMAKAARRGADVKLVLPSVSSVPAALAAGRAAYGDLLEAGAQIWEIQFTVLHSKFATIDGVWTTVGSSNLDRRSVVFNNEVDAVIFGRQTAAAARAIFDDDIGKSRPITLAEWRKRPLGEKLYELYARTWEFLM
ncbi:MAG TPA: phosphatidylserine/phosphatidylglycerophosphate/cardiolipin synthase family protein [Acetobacteraceae bacterium]|nr:phosphatidylserine/phosphatidylglycerophosphate/cardiolipin synthase family protein [Acetobacteraceae bacterium]